MNTKVALLEARKLTKYYNVTRGIMFSSVARVKAVDGVSFAVSQGEGFGLVGESGCGKTTTGKLILLLEKPTSGQIVFCGKDVASLTGKELADYRKSVQPVFQDPFSSLNPRMRVGDIICEPLVARDSPPRAAVKQRLQDVLQEVGLAPRSASLYPHEFSGGQRQRIALARALISRPQCLVLDEPVSALDTSIRAQIINLIMGIQERHGLSYLMIAHDLSVVRHMTTKTAVMYLGKIVEMSETRDLFGHPLHPYTRALLAAVPQLKPGSMQKLGLVEGEVPSPLDIPPGCRFHPRCRFVMAICRESEPELRMAAGQHQVACHLEF
ncbi:MAG: ATP-binding cassette domain-containing protein [Dehalococcoidia bacterium]|nr:ATP-binding cassette domain-containing protein [Dehalococcoidia bacterium]